MEKEDVVLFNIIKQGGIKIENSFGLKNIVDFGEMNPKIYKNRYSVLKMKKYEMPIWIRNEEKHKLVEIRVFFKISN